MAKSEIIITQTAHGSSAAGVAVRGLDLYSVGSEAITFTCSSDGSVGVTKYEWTLVERPPESAAVLQGSDSSEAFIQADVSGRYVVALRVNDLGDGTPGYSSTVIGVSYPIFDSSGGTDYGDWDPPAFKEGVKANWTDKYGADNPHGAQRELYRVISDIRERYLVTLEARTPNKIKFFCTPDGALVQRTNNAAWQAACATMPLDMSNYNYGTVKFGAVLYREGAGGSADASLYYGATPVTGALAATSAGPITALSGALTVGAGAGELQTTPTIYTINIRLSGGGGGDFCNLYDVFLDLDA